jgi:hypothetical protein
MSDGGEAWQDRPRGEGWHEWSDSDEDHYTITCYISISGGYVSWGWDEADDPERIGHLADFPPGHRFRPVPPPD